MTLFTAADSRLSKVDLLAHSFPGSSLASKIGLERNCSPPRQSEPHLKRTGLTTMTRLHPSRASGRVLDQAKSRLTCTWQQPS